jgi:hypothetical protein
MLINAQRNDSPHERSWSTQQALNRGASAAIRHLVELDAGSLLEQHGGEMERVADAGMRDIDLARLPLTQFRMR